MIAAWSRFLAAAAANLKHCNELTLVSFLRLVFGRHDWMAQARLVRCSHLSPILLSSRAKKEHNTVSPFKSFFSPLSD